jgi:hypothetical protein
VHSFNTLLWVSYFWIFGQWVLNFDGLRAQYCLGFELCFGFFIKRAKHDLAWVFQKNPKQIQKQSFPNIAFEYLQGLINSSKKGYEVKLAILSTKLNFTPFYMNTQCLMRHDVRLFNEKLKMITFSFFLFSSCKPRLFINRSSNKSQNEHD